MQKLENNPMAGLYNTSENFWMGKVRGVARSGARSVAAPARAVSRVRVHPRLSRAR